MTITVFAMVLAAAFLHAVWNTLVKVNGDRLVAVTIIMSSQAVISFFVLPFVTFPPAEAWPYILSSVVLHNAYCLFLITAYRYGDLSHVYPIARGSAPLLVALLSVFFAGEVLNRVEMLAVLLVTLGVTSLGLTRGVNGIREWRAVSFALGTGMLIAGYTLVDGLGARLGDSAHGYVFWSFALHGIPLALLTGVIRKRRALVQIKKTWRIGVSAGVASLLAYWIVIWAMTQAPFALVSALRETSVVFAVLFGVILLKERLDIVRLAGVTISLIGTVMLKTGR